MAMSSDQKINVSWLVNIILVPACSFFLYKTYDRMEAMQASQVEMRVKIQDMATRLEWNTATATEQSAQIRDMGRKLDRLAEQRNDEQ